MDSYNELYTDRVIQGADGVYRWLYDMDMWHNHYLRNLMLKLMGLIFGAICVFMVVLLSINEGFSLVLTVIFLVIFATVLLLTLIGYWIAALCMKGHYRLCFDMYEDGIVLVRSASAKKAGKAVSAVSAAAAVASVATGNIPQAAMLGANAVNSSMNAVESFSAVHKITETPKYDAINLIGIMHAFQVWIPEEDYAFVRSFIYERIPPRARG